MKRGILSMNHTRSMYNAVVHPALLYGFGSVVTVETDTSGSKVVDAFTV